MKTLLLNSTYQPISFVPERKALKLFVKGKIDVLSSWDQIIRWGTGGMQYPSVIRLKYYVRWIPKKVRFNRMGVFRRDKNTCMYCGKPFRTAELTIDHVQPASKGGKTNWHNCVTSCFDCNNKKRNRTPEEAKMKLLVKPVVPRVNLTNEFHLSSQQHPDWGVYLGLDPV